MSAAAALLISDPPERAVELFRLRSEARAILVAHGHMTLHEAVDGLQEAAQATGLIPDFGVDTVQSWLAEAFEPWSEYFQKC